MRIPVDFSAGQAEALSALAKRNGCSRAALIRAAINDYLNRHHRGQADDAFGLWGKGKVDGLAYQKSIRTEW